MARTPDFAAPINTEVAANLLAGMQTAHAIDIFKLFDPSEVLRVNTIAAVAALSLHQDAVTDAQPYIRALTSIDCDIPWELRRRELDALEYVVHNFETLRNALMDNGAYLAVLRRIGGFQTVTTESIRALLRSRQILQNLHAMPDASQQVAQASSHFPKTESIIHVTCTTFDYTAWIFQHLVTRFRRVLPPKTVRPSAVAFFAVYDLAVAVPLLKNERAGPDTYRHLYHLSERLRIVGVLSWREGAKLLRKFIQVVSSKFTVGMLLHLIRRDTPVSDNLVQALIAYDRSGRLRKDSIANLKTDFDAFLQRFQMEATLVDVFDMPGPHIITPDAAREWHVRNFQGQQPPIAAFDTEHLSDVAGLELNAGAHGKTSKCMRATRLAKRFAVDMLAAVSTHRACHHLETYGTFQAAHVVIASAMAWPAVGVETVAETASLDGILFYGAFPGLEDLRQELLNTRTLHGLDNASFLTRLRSDDRPTTAPMAWPDNYLNGMDPSVWLHKLQREQLGSFLTERDEWLPLETVAWLGGSDLTPTVLLHRDEHKRAWEKPTQADVARVWFGLWSSWTDGARRVASLEAALTPAFMKLALQCMIEEYGALISEICVCSLVRRLQWQQFNRRNELHNNEVVRECMTSVLAQALRTNVEMVPLLNDDPSVASGWIVSMDRLRQRHYYNPYTDRVLDVGTHIPAVESSGMAAILVSPAHFEGFVYRSIMELRRFHDHLRALFIPQLAGRVMAEIMRVMLKASEHVASFVGAEVREKIYEGRATIDRIYRVPDNRGSPSAKFDSVIRDLQEAFGMKWGEFMRLRDPRTDAFMEQLRIDMTDTSEHPPPMQAMLLLEMYNVYEVVVKSYFLSQADDNTVVYDVDTLGSMVPYLQEHQRQIPYIEGPCGILWFPTFVYSNSGRVVEIGAMWPVPEPVYPQNSGEPPHDSGEQHTQEPHADPLVPFTIAHRDTEPLRAQHHIAPPACDPNAPPPSRDVPVPPPSRGLDPLKFVPVQDSDHLPTLETGWAHGKIGGKEATLNWATGEVRLVRDGMARETAQLCGATIAAPSPAAIDDMRMRFSGDALRELRNALAGASVSDIAFTVAELVRLTIEACDVFAAQQYASHPDLELDARGWREKMRLDSESMLDFMLERVAQRLSEPRPHFRGLVDRLEEIQGELRKPQDIESPLRAVMESVFAELYEVVAAGLLLTPPLRLAVESCGRIVPRNRHFQVALSGGLTDNSAFIIMVPAIVTKDSFVTAPALGVAIPEGVPSAP